ncbi:hypothetical protein [Bacillus toyonensis]|uniref:hypothetical protein n=1 Tax=Bacillus toyonensis TaxID=155322 RepID=UPI000B440E0E|nr:hypothetical protein [Bacillus toyonensis]MBX0355326.1 hypothetical protein [Bacillus toyonensis]OTX39833.1 hypothetical protein BK717_07215 [Bacillus thuringiensis serovar malayensis]OUB01672.1 hypothetical protein BK709_30225 [Bacillus thuringiensis serovar shandongiensis]WIG29998.1 hypothetical protein QPL81_15230 [Bacillus toyonensis]
MSNFDYIKKLDTLKKRRQGLESITKSTDYVSEQTGMYDEFPNHVFFEAFEQINESPIIKYIIGAMEPVDQKYTMNTFDQGKRVINQLSKLKDEGYNFSFEYQGSVVSNTHIKAHSDIDILVLHAGFFTLESPLKPEYPYKGDPVKDLCDLREASYNLLKREFPAVNVDNTGAKSIGLEGGSLTRKVDVVPSNWYDTVLYNKTNLSYHRGVMVLDYKKKERIANTPFYHNKLLEDKDNNTFHNYKKIIRLLKTIKADSDKKIGLSSYDIAALMYHMEDNEYCVGESRLLLLTRAQNFMLQVYKNETYRKGLQVPDESRFIFEEGKATVEDLWLLIGSLAEIIEDLKNELSKTGKTFAEEIAI